MKTPLIVTLTLLLTACATSETSTVTKVEAAQSKQIEETRAVAKALGTQLGGKLKEAMTASGPAKGWEAEALASFAARMKLGEEADTMEFAEVVTDASGKHMRYAKVITIQPVCLTCHGPSESIPEGVRARLSTEYPLDQATGYSAGELRGAVVITRPL